MAAEMLARGGASVTVYERMPSVGRKFLLAGRGGLNLTHSEDLERFLLRYGDAAARLGAAIEALPPAALRAWSWCGLHRDLVAGSDIIDRLCECGVESADPTCSSVNEALKNFADAIARRRQLMLPLIGKTA